MSGQTSPGKGAVRTEVDSALGPVRDTVGAAVSVFSLTISGAPSVVIDADAQRPSPESPRALNAEAASGLREYVVEWQLLLPS